MKFRRDEGGRTAARRRLPSGREDRLCSPHFDAVRGGVHVLYMSSFDIKEGRMTELQMFVKKNEDLFQKHAPKGWTYRGTYGYVLGFGRFGVATMWEFAKYGDFDAWREHRDETWMRLSREFVDFTTTGSSREAVLLREIGDVNIIEKAKIEEDRARRSR